MKAEKANAEPNNSEIIQSKRELLMGALATDGEISISDVVGSEVKILAILSLVEDVDARLDADTPNIVKLTEAGQKLAHGVRALSRG